MRLKHKYEKIRSKNDLTYFIKYQLKTTESAFQDLKNYIPQKIQEKTELYDFRKIRNINERQINILKYLSDNPKFTFTIKEMQNKFDTAYETARKDILYLEDKGLLEKTTSGKRNWYIIAQQDLMRLSKI